MSNSVRPHRQQPTRLCRSWDSPVKNTGVGCHFLLQCMKVKVKSLSCVRLLATPWTAAHQAPLSMGFSRQEYWSGVPLSSPGTTLGTVLLWSDVWLLKWLRLKNVMCQIHVIVVQCVTAKRICFISGYNVTYPLMLFPCPFSPNHQQ